MAMESSLNILSSFLLTRTNSFEIVEQLSAALCISGHWFFHGGWFIRREFVSGWGRAVVEFWGG